MPRPTRSTTWCDSGASPDELPPLAGVPAAFKDNMNLHRHAHHLLARRSSRTTRASTTAPRCARLLHAGARADRQAQHGRVRVRLVDRELRVRPDPQPVGPRARARRLVRRLGRGGERGHGHDNAGQRHRRLDPSAGVAVRRRGDEADLRPRVALRVRRVCELARPDRARSPRRSRSARWRSTRSAARTRWTPRASSRPAEDFTSRARRRRRRACASRSCATCSRWRACAPEVRPQRSPPPRSTRSSVPRWARSTCPRAQHGLSAYYIIGPAEASSNLARFDGIRYGHRVADAEDVLDLYMRSRAEGFGPESIRRIMLGTYALSAGYYDAYYGQAQKARTVIISDFAGVRRLRRAAHAHLADDRVQDRREGGRPARDVPLGLLHDPGEPRRQRGACRSRSGLGRTPGCRWACSSSATHFAESTVLRAAAALERAVGVRPRRRRCGAR